MGSLIQSKKRIMMMQTNSELPSAYQKAEYVQSDGTSYILTDVIPSNDLGFDCVFYTESNLSNVDNYGCIFGGRRSSGNNDFQLTTYSNSNNGSFRYGDSYAANADITLSQKCSASKRYLEFINCAGNTVLLSSYNWDTNVKITLFILNNNGIYYQGGKGCRIYEMRFYNGNDLIRNYIPCIRKSDNVVGMYETKTKQFLTSPVGVLSVGN